MGSAPVRSMYHERPDYRVALLARTNVMTAWLVEICLARSNACLTVDEQDHGLVVYFPIRDHRLPELPHISAIIPVHQSRRVVGVPGRQVIQKHIRRLDDVIINADQDQVVAFHWRPFQSEAGSGLAALTVIGAPSQLRTPAPDEVQRSSTVSEAST